MIDFSIIQNKKILVFGDIMLDTYYEGNVKRISPEAPVPIVKISQIKNVLGGAANVAANISSLGGISYLIGVCGNDDKYILVSDLLNKCSIRHSIIKTKYPTIVKSRVVAGNQQIVRFDYECDEMSLSDEECSVLERQIDLLLPECDLVIISDYAKGLCSERMCQRLIAKAKIENKLVIVDPKGKNWTKYQGAYIITPNLKEYADIVGSMISNENDSILGPSSFILSKYQISHLLVTRSEKGMTLVSSDTVCHIKTDAREVFDVSGAGDTVIASLAVSLTLGASAVEAAKFANKAAGVVVGKRGTASVTLEELTNTCNDGKIVKSTELEKLVIKLREKSQKIVFTNGCFDILHRGHIGYLKEASNYGDILIVGLNSDSSIQKLKGPSRPINIQDDRAYMLAAYDFISYVVIFDEETPYNIISIIRPDVLIKGGDYELENVVGREFANETIILPFVQGYSTSNIIKKGNLV